MHWEWSENALSDNPTITPDFVSEFITKPWNWGGIGLSRNPSLTSEFIIKNKDKDWEWDGTALRKGLSRNEMNGHPCYPNEIVELKSLYGEKLYQRLESINSILINWLNNNKYNKIMTLLIISKCILINH
jgi:hypothetical protein